MTDEFVPRESGPVPKLPPRDPAGHKGTFGTVAVVGGCAASGSVMLGAPVLAARAALRAGAGLVRLVLPEPLLTAALQTLPSATGVGLAVDGHGRVIAHEAAATLDRVFKKTSAIVVGPGLGSTEIGGSAVESMMLRCLGQTDIPVVADADGLSALAGLHDFAGDLRAPAIITPHPGEYARLAAGCGLPDAPSDEAGRTRAAEAMAGRLGVVCVLKGRGTVVSDGQRTWECGRGHPCLGTAGTGDVLAGLIAGLTAQFVTTGPRRIGPYERPIPPDRPLDLFDAARVGVEVHAIAGERWASRTPADGGMLAGELADELPRVIGETRD